MKAKYCRFCHLGKVALIFPATTKKPVQDIELFTCTNCGFGFHGPIVACNHCGITYVDESISQKQISTYYEVAQDPLYFSEQPAREKTFRRYLRRLEKKYPQKGRLLDIGTNTGLFVKLARDQGWDAIGIEPNKWAVDYAKKNYGVKIINQPFEKGVFAPGSFSVVTMWDVIEHFTDPVVELHKVLWYLSPGGLFAFSTVDPQSALARIMGTKWSWYMVMHRVFFNRTSANYYLKKTGFANVTFLPHVRNLSLGYLATRLAAVNPRLSGVSSWLINSAGIGKMIVPYYANDLYDCYAVKPTKV